MPSWISSRRAGRGSRARVLITPHSTSEGKAAPPPRTTPYPVLAVPGSMPSTSTLAASSWSLEVRQLGVVDVEVGPDLLHVVEILERLDELEQGLDVGARHGDRGLRHHRQLGLGGHDAPGLEGTLHGVERGGVGGDDVRLVVLATKILRPCLERRLERRIFILVARGVERELSL